MKASHLILGTQRENPADAEIISHQLMIRAGLVRQVSSWIYNWLPIGKKVLQKVENIIRTCLLYTSPSPRDQRGSRMPSSA